MPLASKAALLAALPLAVRTGGAESLVCAAEVRAFLARLVAGATVDALPAVVYVADVLGFNTLAAKSFAAVPLTSASLGQRPAGLAGGFDAAPQQYVAPVASTYEVSTGLRLAAGAAPAGCNYAWGPASPPRMAPRCCG